MFARMVLIGLLPLLAMACRLVGGPQPTPTPVETAAPSPTVEAAPTETPAVGETPTPTELPPPGGPIGPGDFEGLAHESVALPVDFVQNVLWPGPDTLMLHSEQEIYPVTLSPLTVGSPQPLNLPAPPIAFAPDGSSAAAAPENGRLGIYDLDGGLLHELDMTAPYFAGYSQDGRWLTAGEQMEMAVRVFDVTTGAQVARLTGFETAAPVYSAATAPGGETLLWWARATLQFQDIATGSLGQQVMYQDFINTFAFDSTGSRLAVSVLNQIDILSVPDGQVLTTLTLSEPARGLAFSPDGNVLAAAYGQSVQAWDAQTWLPLPPLAAGETPVNRVSFSPDGRAIAALDDENLHVWRKP